MLVVVLNTCTKEELEDDEDVAMISSPVSPTTPTSPDSVERRKVIKNKIMAVGRMARVFALLRCGAFCCSLKVDMLTPPFRGQGGIREGVGA
jgi:hypothetical protein